MKEKGENKVDDLDIKFSLQLFMAIRDNRSIHNDITKYDIDDFKNFTEKANSFFNKLNKNDMSAFSDLSSIMSSWGYYRKYCGMCGRPVISKILRIQGGKIVCVTCHASYNITEKLYENDEQDKVSLNVEKHTESEKTTESDKNTLFTN